MNQHSHFCPVCRRDRCDHLLPRDVRRETLESLAPYAVTPLDLGVARFAADVAELLQAPPTPPAPGPYYFILADYGRRGVEWAARDPLHTTWESTIEHIASGEIRPVRVLQVAEPGKGPDAWGVVRDVTEGALQAAELLRSYVDNQH